MADVSTPDARLRASLAALLRRVLAEEEMTQRELARRMGVSEPRITHILSGECNLSTKTLVRFAEAVGREVVIGIHEKARSR